jgi:hypothetical protein
MFISGKKSSSTLALCGKCKNEEIWGMNQCFSSKGSGRDSILFCPVGAGVACVISDMRPFWLEDS